MHLNELQGLRILNTRPLHQNKSLTTAITQAGGVSIEFPTLAIEAIENWQDTLCCLMDISHAIFTSENSVRYFFASYPASWPSHIQVIAIGHATAHALQDYKIKVDHIPSTANSESLILLDTLQNISSQNILLIKGQGGRTFIEESLVMRGAQVIPLPVYRRTLPQITQQAADSLWQDQRIDIILFTSEQAMQQLFSLLGEKAHAWLRQTPCLVISDRLASAAHQLGIQTVLMSPYDTLITKLREYVRKGFFL